MKEPTVKKTRCAPSHRRARTRWSKVGALLLAAALVLAACGDGGSDTSGDGPGSGGGGGDGARTPEIVMGHMFGFATFDPVMVPAQTIDYLRPVYDSLIIRKGIDTFEPGLATEWAYDGEAKTFTMKLRDDVEFSDGEAFDAEVVKANIERGMATEGGPWSPVYGTMESVEVLGDHEVRIHFGRPLPSIVESMSSLPGMMVSPAALDDDEALKKRPVGSGPWVLDESGVIPGDQYTYVAREGYWDPEVQRTERIVIKVLADATARANAVRSGQVHIITSDGTQAKALESHGLEVGSMGLLVYVMDVTDREGEVVEALGDKRVRQAMAHALDRETLLQAVYGGLGDAKPSIFPEGSIGYSDVVAGAYEFDLDKARSLLEDAGYPDGFNVTVHTFAANESISMAVAGQLAEIGITLDIVSAPDGGTWQAAIADKKSPVMITGLGVRSPFEVYQTFGAENGRYNPFKVASPGVEEAVAKIETADPESDEIAEHYAEMMEQLIIEDATVLPVFSAVVPVVMVPEMKAELDTQAQALPDPRNLYLD